MPKSKPNRVKSSYIGRVTLKFNINDPVQKYAYELISQKGRAKSAYISECFRKLDDMERNGGHSFTEKDLRILAENVANILREENRETPVKAVKEASQSIKEEDVYEPDEALNSLLSGLEDFE